MYAHGEQKRTESEPGPTQETRSDSCCGIQVTFSIHDHPALVRFQANFYNILNLTNLQPITFGSTDVVNPLFRLWPGADSGRRSIRDQGLARTL